MTALRSILRSAAVATVVVLSLASAACSGRRPVVVESVGPRLVSARLGSVRCALTCDGDWLGGVPPESAVAEDFELAARRGIGVVLDLRTADVRGALGLEESASVAGLEFMPVDVDAADAPVSERAIERVLGYLATPGRPRAILLGDDGRVPSMLYAIHLSVDADVELDEAIRSARATGLQADDEAFVRSQVARLRGGA
ncbi:MAG: hypothetical protein AAFU73_00550 [Planctomycetota bacterium]